VSRILEISKIHTIYTLELTSEYSYPGEAHDFWEFVYVDKGFIQVTAGEDTVNLNQGQIIFHKPMEFHTIRTLNNAPANVIIMSFTTKSPDIIILENKSLHLPKTYRTKLAAVVKEASAAGIPHEFRPGVKKLKEPLYGSEQLVCHYLEIFLIYLIRELKQLSLNHSNIWSEIGLVNHTASVLVNEVIGYMHDNIHRALTFGELTKNFYVGATKLKDQFKEHTGISIMKYFYYIKMHEAKRLIRRRQKNITEVAKSLGFENVHIFSASFKKKFGMSPTEYISSIRSQEDLMKEMADV